MNENKTSDYEGPDNNDQKNDAETTWARSNLVPVDTVIFFINSDESTAEPVDEKRMKIARVIMARIFDEIFSEKESGDIIDRVWEDFDELEALGITAISMADGEPITIYQIKKSLNSAQYHGNPDAWKNTSSIELSQVPTEYGPNKDAFRKSVMRDYLIQLFGRA